MTMVTVAAAVVQFVGIVVFSDQLSPGQDHLQAIMPRISAPDPHARKHGSVSEERPVPTINPHVEEHTAFIAFRACDYVSSRGWAPRGLETVPGYLFVPLDGEHVEFSAPGLTNSGTLRPSSARPKLDRQGRLKLPHLRPFCTSEATPVTLKKEFQPPFDGAVAVFDIRSGRVSACTGVINKEQSTRVDTRLTIDNAGLLVISASKTNESSKEIHLRDGAHVLVAHLPNDAVTGQSSATANSSQPHYTAYYDMIDHAGACSPDFISAIKSETPDGPCETSSDIRQIGSEVVAAVDVPPDWSSFLRIDFECSNSQWP